MMLTGMFTEIQQVEKRSDGLVVHLVPKPKMGHIFSELITEHFIHIEDTEITNLLKKQIEVSGN